MSRDAIALIGLLDDPNCRAFLRLIREGESSQDDDAYRWLFGSTRTHPKLFDSFADHPRVRTYETHDGQFIKNGKIDYTTAAGAPQITETTWNGVAKRLGLKDFSPRSQDIAALALIDGRGALDDVIAGRIERAMFLCRNEWASLPASTWGQPTQSLQRALTTYQRYGGSLNTSAERVQKSPEPVHVEPKNLAAAPPQTRETKLAKESPMAFPLLPLAGLLIDIFSPLAKEKINKEMARHTDNPEIQQQIAEGVVAAAQTITGKPDPLEAVVAAKADPAVVQQIEDDTLDNLAKMAPVLDKLAEWDKEAWAAEEGSREAAAVRARLDGNDMAPKLADRAFAVYLVVLILTAGAIGAQMWFAADHKPAGELVGFFIAMATLGARQFEKVFDYRFGSSRSSAAKDAVIGELGRRGK